MTTRENHLEIVQATIDGQQVNVLAFQRQDPQGNLSAPMIIGQVLYGPSGQPDWARFVPNPSFVEYYTGFMRGHLQMRPRNLASAKVESDESLFVIDSRTPNPNGAVPPFDIIGAYATLNGQPILGSFNYNPQHLLVLPDGTLSVLLEDEELYQALLVTDT